MAYDDLDIDDYGADIPWMALAVTERWHDFDIDLDTMTDEEISFVNKKGDKVTVNQIQFESDLDDNDIVPFWACRNLLETIAAQKKKTGKLALKYRRSYDEATGINTAEFSR